MTKVIIFGGSHVAQLLLGYIQLKSEKALPVDFKIDFVSAPGPVLGRLRLAGSKLLLLEKPEIWPTQAFPKETFDIWYDQTAARIKILSGNDSGELDLSLYEKSFFIGGQLLKDWDRIDLALSAGTFSSGCLATACVDIIRESHFHRCLTELGPIDPGLDLFSSFEPIQNETAPSFKELSVKPGRLLPVTELFRKSAISIGYNFIPFPAILLNSSGNAVSAEFHNGKENDFAHMNTLGGSLLLRSMLSTIEGLGQLEL